MSYRPVDLGIRVRLEPGPAKDTILATFREAGANAKGAAERLGVTERTLHRYFAILGIEKDIARIRARARAEGWIKSARWPEKNAEKTT